MTANDRWREIRELFERAVEDRPADAAAWLDAIGIVDWQVREEVLSLIRHHAAAGSFLVEPASDRLAELMADDRPLEAGHTIGHFTIVRELGRGGMGRVYLADDARLGRSVALKALSPDLTADPEHRERLRREARAAAGLAHPGICTIHALEEFDGELFIVAEFVDGHTLRDEIERGSRQPADAVARTARELAAALAYAHSRGVTHRDLKPENVMRARDGALKILDFGLARVDTAAADLEGRVTQPGTVVGTPAYMAPEQLQGARADARADVFAFGVLIYEYACGIHPFHAPTALGVIGRILEGTAEPVEARRPDLPAALVSGIHRSLRKSPADRFASAGEIVRALEDGSPARDHRRMTTWWRTHQAVAVVTYFIACGFAWQIKEWQPGLATVLFAVIGVAATIAGVFRGHLVFTERVNGPDLAAEHRRAQPVTLAMDLLLGLVLGVNGILLAAARPLPAVLAMALGVGIVLARLVIEPATTSASFR
jgi:predicted Ser/Thr protein kinase